MEFVGKTPDIVVDSVGKTAVVDSVGKTDVVDSG